MVQHRSRLARQLKGDAPDWGPIGILGRVAGACNGLI